MFAQYHRQIWAGGEIASLLLNNKIPPDSFAMHCLKGDAAACSAQASFAISFKSFFFLPSLTSHEADSKPCTQHPHLCAQISSSASKRELIEFRTGVLRATPLMLTILGCAIYQRHSFVDVIDVCRLLLQHGARVDARDVCGKTALHYICGTRLPTIKSNPQHQFFRSPFIHSCFISSMDFN